MRSTGAEERVSVATQWQLMWWRFRKHRLAMIGAVVVMLFYLGGRRSPTSWPIRTPNAPRPTAPSSLPAVHLFDEGKLQPYVYALKGVRDPETIKRVYVADTRQDPCRRSSPTASPTTSSASRQPCTCSASPRQRRARPLHPGHRSAGPRHVVAPDVRHPRLNDDWPGRRDPQPVSRHHAGRHLRPAWAASSIPASSA